jgi:hypothetical protein
MKRNVYAVRLEPGRIVAAEISDATAAVLFSEGRSILLATEGELAELARREKRAFVILGRGTTKYASPGDAEIRALHEDNAAHLRGDSRRPASAVRRRSGSAIRVMETVGKMHQLLRRHFGRASQLQMTMCPNGTVLQAHCGSRASQFTPPANAIPSEDQLH